MAKVVSSRGSCVVVEADGVELKIVRGHGGPAIIGRAGRPGHRGEYATFVSPAEEKVALRLAEEQFLLYDEREGVHHWHEPVRVGFVALEALGELAGGSAKHIHPQAVQLELFPTPKEHFGIYSRED